MGEKVPRFPYAKTWSKKSMRELFDSLIEYSPLIAKLISLDGIKDRIPSKYRKATKEEILFITGDVNLEDYRNINVITDFFTEEIRLTTSKRKFMEDTPMEMWKKHFRDIIEAGRILQVEANCSSSPVQPYFIRQAVFEMTKESSNFRPTLALSFYKYFKPKNILDISAGWGDRLIGALAYSVHEFEFSSYVGFDPNINLQQAYRQIVDEFIPEDLSREQFRVFPLPFEDSTETLLSLRHKFDLVFSSIPYFDFEQYDVGHGASPGRKNQSTVRYKDQTLWVINFLIPTIRIAARFLEVGGNLALNMEGYYVTILFKHYDDVFSAANLKYQGIIGYGSDDPQDKKIHPTYVWSKRA